MLRVRVAERLEDLAASLAGTLSEAPADPMAPELVAVPTAGMKRWLSLELSRHLGATAPGRTDGVCANVEMVFPGDFRRRISGQDPDTDPWRLERLVWVLLEELHRPVELPDGVAERLALAPGATEWARARRIADLFDSYMTHRPAMVRSWHEGRYLDGAGAPIASESRWQPDLWRRVRERIGVASPAETLGAVADSLREGTLVPDIPGRVALFGLTTVPGGAPFLGLLDAVAERHDVHLLLAQPSADLAVRVASDAGRRPETRAADRSAEHVHNDLLRSWGRSSRETMVLVGSRLDTGSAASVSPTASSDATVLARLQESIRSDLEPAGDLSPSADDRSVVIHSCHGDTRQVEVLRDQILHLLAHDPSLAEDDIAVICPELDRFAPLIESVFGAPEGVTSSRPHDDESTSLGSGIDRANAARRGVPRLRYRLADRSLGVSYELLSAVGSLVELLASRFSERAVVDFASLPVVRNRFGFDDDDLGMIADWVDSTQVRWGLDGEHRSRWDHPDWHPAGTWRRALDRLLLGVAATAEDSALAGGSTLPVAIEGSGVPLLGRFAQMMQVLADLEGRCRTAHTAAEWAELISTAADSLFEADRDRAWERQRLDALVEAIATDAEGSEVPLGLDDLRHLLGEHLGGAIARPGFFRGGITISSPTPLRGIPHRVVCVLGMDQSAFGNAAVDGDDLVAAEPHLGDRDRRTDNRQILLDTVLSAGEQLVIVRSGADVVTNQPVYPAVVLAELIDSLALLVEPSARKDFLDRLTVVHPRQRFDEANFDPDTPWSFDPAARDAAGSRRERRPFRSFAGDRLPAEHPRVLAAEGSTRRVHLSTLRRFLDHPPRYFLQRVLEMQLSDLPERDQTERLLAPVGSSGIPPAAAGRDLPVELDNLERWGVRTRLLSHLLAGGDFDSFVKVERARDGLPAGTLGDACLQDALEVAEALVDCRAETGIGEREPCELPVEVTLEDGTVIVGSVRDEGASVPGPVSTSVSQAKDKYRIGAWLELLALTAHDPTTQWQATLINHAAKNPSRVDLAVAGEGPEQRSQAASSALALVVDLFRRGLREPLPLFPAFSGILHKGGPIAKWHGDRFTGGGDGDDAWVITAFDNADEDRITSLELRDHDPGGAHSDRARRYASVLWSGFDESVDSGEGGAR